MEKPTDHGRGGESAAGGTPRPPSEGVAQPLLGTLAYGWDIWNARRLNRFAFRIARCTGSAGHIGRFFCSRRRRLRDQRCHCGAELHVLNWKGWKR